MINALLNGILNILQKAVEIILTPVNLLVANVFPSLATYITAFDNFISTIFGGAVNWFLYMLPPNFRNLLAVYFVFLIAIQGIMWSYYAITHIYEIYQKVKFW